MKAMRRLQSSENCTITNNGITRTGTSTVPKKSAAATHHRQR